MVSVLTIDINIRYERQSRKPKRTLKDILLRTKKNTAHVSEAEISSSRN